MRLPVIATASAAGFEGSIVRTFAFTTIISAAKPALIVTEKIAAVTSFILRPKPEAKGLKAKSEAGFLKGAASSKSHGGAARGHRALPGAQGTARLLWNHSQRRFRSLAFL